MALRQGQSVIIPASNLTGTLRFLGNTQFRPGNWAGIELHSIGAGKNNGSVDGVSYFTCPPNTGLFVPADKVRPAPPSTPLKSHSPTTNPNRLSGVFRSSSSLKQRPVSVQPRTSSSKSLQRTSDRLLDNDTRRHSASPQKRPVSFSPALTRSPKSTSQSKSRPTSSHNEFLTGSKQGPRPSQIPMSTHIAAPSRRSSSSLQIDHPKTNDSSISSSPRHSNNSFTHGHSSHLRDSAVVGDSGVNSPDDFSRYSSNPESSYISPEDNDVVQALKGSIEQLDAKLSRKDSIIAEQTAVITQLKARLSTQLELTNEIDNIQQTITQLEVDALSKDQSSQNLEAELKATKLQLDETKASLDSATNDKKQLLVDVDTHVSRIKVLEHELKSLNNAMNEFMKIGEDRVGVVEKLHAEIKDKTCRIAALSLQVDEHQVDLKQSHQHISDLQQDKQSIATEFESLSLRVVTLETQLEAQSTESRNWQEKCHSLTSLLQESQQLCADIPVLRSANEKQTRELSDLKAELLGLQNNQATSSSVLSERHRQHSVMEHELTLKKQLVKNLESEINSYTEKLSKLEHQALTQGQQIKQLELQHESQSAVLLTTEGELKDALKQVAMMNVSLKSRSDMDLQMDEMEKQFAAEMKKAVQASKLQISTLETELEEAKSESMEATLMLQSMQEDLVAAKTLAKSRWVEIQEAKEEVNRIQHDYSTSHTRITSLTEQLSSLRSAHEVLEKEYHTSLNNSAELGIVRGKLMTADSRIQELMTVIAGHEEQQATLKKTVQRLKATIAESHESNEMSEQKIRELDTQLKAAKESLAVKENEASQMRNQVRQLKQNRRETMTSYMGTIDTLMADMMSLQTKYDAVMKSDAIRQTFSDVSERSGVNKVVSNRKSVTFPIDYKETVPQSIVKRTRPLTAHEFPVDADFPKLSEQQRALAESGE